MDIVERLRELQGSWSDVDKHDFCKAADEIERLRKHGRHYAMEVERLRAEVADWRHQFKNMEAIADMSQEQLNTIALLDKASEVE